MLDKLIQGIEIDIGKELGGEVADGQSFAPPTLNRVLWGGILSSNERLPLKW